MSSKSKLIAIGTLLIVLILFSLICLFIPTIKIEINGDKNLTIIVDGKYEEKGATAYLLNLFNKEKLNVEINGKVDTKKVGRYIISYKVKNKGQQKEVIRIVNVIDNVQPNITLKRSVAVCKNNNIIEIDAVAEDNYDGDISDQIKYKIVNDDVYISVTDSSKNETIIKQKVKYIDNESPTLTLKGDKTIYLNVGEIYEEYGVDAYDSCDGVITDKVKITGIVDTNTVGNYKITYKVIDSVGKEVTLNRTIIVSDNTENKYPVVNGATIYLTFDDGPGPYTEQILEVLEKYDVKATFFVTNQFPDYQNLIKKSYDAGHSIGIHTYTHKWNIYESVDSYLDDYQKIEDLVFKEIGIRPKIFRFPGGSSNTVSRNYCKGIMTELSRIMTDRGYIYFDWTFDSGDTSKNNNSVEAIIKNIKSNLKGDGEYVILMHDIKKNTLLALPQIIEYAKAHGYNFASINENSPTEHFKIAN